MFCENCGSPLPEDSKFCLSCGAKVPDAGSEGQAEQEAAVAADAVQVDEAPVADAVVQTEQQQAPAEPVQNVPQPPPAAPAPQPKPAQPSPQVQTYQQPAPQVQTYQQPAPQAQAYQQPAPQAQANQQPAIAKTERPLPVWKYMGMMLLTGIPILGFIMILVWSFGRSWNKNTRNYARAVLIFGIIIFVLSIAGIIINLEALRALTDYFNSNFEIGFVG